MIVATLQFATKARDWLDYVILKAKYDGVINRREVVNKKGRWKLTYIVY